MNISRIIGGVAALTFFAGVALAESPKPPQDSKATTPVASAQMAKPSNDGKAVPTKVTVLSEKQMDTVSAGFYVDGLCCQSSIPWAFVAKIVINQ